MAPIGSTTNALSSWHSNRSPLTAPRDLADLFAAVWSSSREIRSSAPARLPLIKLASTAALVLALLLIVALPSHAIIQATQDGKTFHRTVTEREQLDKGLITVRDSGSDICSGVLMTNAWVLTAGHCADHARLNPGRLQVRLLPAASANAQTITVQAVYLFGGYSDEVGPDLALLHLTTPFRINGSASSFANRIWSGGARKEVLGKTVAFYGMGRDACNGGNLGTYQAADLQTDSKTYQASVRPTDPRSPPTATNFFEQDNGTYYSVQQNALGQVPQPGDSGGAAFMFKNGSPFLVGINSGGGCTRQFQVNLAPLRTWIDAVFVSKWTPGEQSQPVYVYPAEVEGTKWSLRDVNTVHWSQAARAAAAMCFNRGFAGGHFDGHQGVLPPAQQSGFGLQCSGGDTRWFDVTRDQIRRTGWDFTDINNVNWAHAGRAAERLCAGFNQGFAGGHFNGHMQNGSYGLFCYRGGAKWFDATDAEIAATNWTFAHVDNVGWAQAARAATGFCRNKGFSGGFMNGHQVPGKFGVVCQGSEPVRAGGSPSSITPPVTGGATAGEKPGKVLGRVKVPGTTTPTSPQSICDRARSARERNSPAAPGLEAQCLASKKPVKLGKVKPSEKPATQTATVTGDVDVYDAPGGAGKVIGMLRKGMQVPFGSCRQDRWCQVTGVGWVWGDFLAH